MHRLTRDEARRIAVRAQLLDADRPGDVVEVIEQLGSIKIDPTATVAPAEQSIPWTRIGWSFEPGQLRKAAEDDRTVFEFDGAFHAGSLLAPMLARMRSRTLRPAMTEYLDANDAFRRDILARLTAEGPLRASDIPDTSEADRIIQERQLQAAGLARECSPWTPVGTAGEPAEVEGSAWRWRVDPGAIATLDDDPGGRAAILNPYDRTSARWWMPRSATSRSGWAFPSC
ncbi:hypothetical protein RYJ27_01765 [Microbacterium limosum]|uniref:Uncharacterized protein n=1 Tax=Microbacterium limosum TaxID=3079935 RepID=A0AAU0MIJ7_9MICO|nr:hypothetical protein [Microbacterium sp. Y20]WOQ69986.1 hypothetical protein RYJ27_01765 [Microbacterium sp. Y20]